jgi:putative SbcD/Mre11-related phosphoesterase
LLSPFTQLKSPPSSRALEFLPGILFDSRRALYFREHRLLAVADLHLGYAWSHRAQGQMLPVAAGDDALQRLKELVAEYRPATVAILGDIVHCALPVPALIEELRALLAIADSQTKLILLAGNHDRALESLLQKIDAAPLLHREHRAGENLFLHGDRAPAEPAARCIIGHEHPAVSLGDGVATSRKFPCFLIAKDVVTLPSFSNWSAHTPIAHYQFMSPIARSARFETALAIMGDRLLPKPLG